MINIGTIPPTSHNWRCATIAALCMLLVAPVTADIYKWTGDDGKINYTQMPPPPGYSSVQLKQAASPPTKTNSTGAMVSSKIKARQQEAKQDKKKDVKTANKNEQNAEIKKLNCDAASRNLAALQEKSQSKFRTASGELLRPTDEERAKMIADTRKQVEKYCNE